MGCNNLTFIDKNAFMNCKLRKVNLTFNELTFKNEDENRNISPFRYCQGLQKVYLKNNKITKIFDDWNKYKELEYVELAYNLIENLQVR